MCLVTLFSNAKLGILSDIAKYPRLFHLFNRAVTSWRSSFLTLPAGANVGSYKPHSVLRLLPTFFQVRASLFSATQVPLSPRHLRMLFRLVRTGICTPYSNRSRADIHHHPPTHRGCSRLHSKPVALPLNALSGREDWLDQASPS